MKENISHLSQNSIPVDEFFEKALFDKKRGYYSTRNPFGKKGDFITAPNISDIFSEIIGIWIVSTWEKLGKPKKINLVELGPGDGGMAKILIRTFKRFPEFYSSLKFFLYEKSDLLVKIQKGKIKDKKVFWIKNLNKIKNGPVIFFGNEFFDAIPIKQFIIHEGLYFEKYLNTKNNKIKEFYKKAKNADQKKLKSFKTFTGLSFIEYPELGFQELDKIIKKISSLSGGILLIDYGYFKPKNISTLQSIKKHKKNNILKNLFKADITYLVNFNLLSEYFIKNNLKLKRIVTQKFFLEKMGIIERANILKKKMSTEQTKNLKRRLHRLLDKKMMGELFKVLFAFKSIKDDILGFD